METNEDTEKQPPLPKSRIRRRNELTRNQLRECRLKLKKLTELKSKNIEFLPESEKLLTREQNAGNNRQYKLEPNRNNKNEQSFKSVLKTIKSEPISILDNYEQCSLENRLKLIKTEPNEELNSVNNEQCPFEYRLMPIKVEHKPGSSEQNLPKHLVPVKVEREQEIRKRKKISKRLMLQHVNLKNARQENKRLHSRMYYAQCKTLGKKRVYTEEQVMQERQRRRELYKKMSSARKEQLQQYRRDYRLKMKAEKIEKELAEKRLETEKYIDVQDSEPVNQIRQLMQEFYKKMTPEKRKQKILKQTKKRMQKQKELRSLMHSIKLEDIKSNKYKRRNFCYTCRVQYLDTVNLMDHIIRHVTNPSVVLFRIDNFINSLCSSLSKNIATNEKTKVIKNSDPSINLPNIEKPLIINEYQQEQIQIKYEPQDFLTNIKTEPEISRKAEIKIEPKIKIEPGIETDIEIDQSSFYTYVKNDVDIDNIKAEPEFC